MSTDKTPGARILVVDDHPEMAEGLADYLGDHGYEVDTAVNGRDAVQMLSASSYDALITDLRMKDLDGMDVLHAAHERDPRLPVFIMTAYGSIENAIEAIRRGAFHYFSKPLKTEEVRIYLERALSLRQFERSHSSLLKEIQERYTFESMVGRSSSMRRIFDLVDRVADSPAAVLITGESGTGKELIARAIHFRGARKDGPFVPINCAAIPATLIESELFGHEAGAFTGAHKPRPGLAVEAHGGTLFLDEVGELPLELQPKLLRVLQEGEVRPVGSDKTRKVDVRILAATNTDLSDSVKAGRFRPDLFYRLNVVPIEVPPLRQRQEDIPILAERLLQRAIAANPRLRARQLSAPAVSVLLGHSWPGNVRELENAVERAATLCTGEIIGDADLKFLAAEAQQDPLQQVMVDLPPLRDLEARYINYVLDRTGGSKVKAAAILGVDPSTLYRREKAGA
ncbi:MAG: sigma-54-dependent Fis family transcriptional regulator [Deltaproteobacteria bacterium]|nr:sigma-54-dependent Fis family transcriptional regulator [Deltaproteobacteria bacterium]